MLASTRKIPVCQVFLNEIPRHALILDLYYNIAALKPCPDMSPARTRYLTVQEGFLDLHLKSSRSSGEHLPAMRRQ